MSRGIERRCSSCGRERRGELNGDELRPARVLADSLRECLLRAGASCSRVVEHSTFGWTFQLRVHGRTFFVVLNLQDTWRILVQQEGWLNFMRAERSLDLCYEWIRDTVFSWLENNVPRSSGLTVNEVWAPPSL